MTIGEVQFRCYIISACIVYKILKYIMVVSYQVVHLHIQILTAVLVLPKPPNPPNPALVPPKPAAWVAGVEPKRGCNKYKKQLC